MNIKEKAYNFKLDKSSSLARVVCVALVIMFGLAVFPLGKIIFNQTSADSVPSLSVSSLGNINLSIQASKNGALSIVKDTVTVNTTNDNGYKLFLATANGTLLRNGLDTSTATNKDKIQPVAGTYNNPVAMALSNSVHGMWGYAVAGASSFNTVYDVTAPDLASKFAAAPAYSNEAFNDQLIYAATTQAVNDDTNIYYGVMANTELNSGTYSTNLIYTVLAEPSSSVPGSNNTVVVPTEDLVEGEYGSDKTATVTTDLLTTDNIGNVEINLVNEDGDIVAVPTSDITVISQVPLTVTFKIPDDLETGKYDVVTTVPKLGKEYIKEDVLEIKTVYTVVYQAGGENVENLPANTTKTVAEQNTTVTLSSQEPSRAGFTFLGWDTNSAAVTPTYAASGTIAMSKSAPTKTLYAIWEANGNYTLGYNANGGENAPSTTQELIISDSQNLAINTTTIPTYNGLAFLGYSEDADATAPDYVYTATTNSFEPSTVTFTAASASKTLYAIWYTVDYSVTYIANGDEAQNIPTAETYHIRKPSYEVVIKPTTTGAIPTRSGYVFLGWNESATLSASQTTPTYIYNTNTHAFTPATHTIPFASPNLVLYAIWAEVYDYSLSYSADGEVVPATYNESTTNTSVSVAISEAVIPIKAANNGISYRFIGYANSSNTSAAADTANGSVTVNYPYNAAAAAGSRFGNSPITITKDAPNKILYAVWEKTYTYTVNYLTNEGTNVPESSIVDSTDETKTITITTSEPSREGYTFAGWDEDPSALTPTYAQSDPITLTSASRTKNLYAIWYRNYTLNYSANNGSNAPAQANFESAELTHSFTINTTTIPTRTGYTFLGYAESADATAADYVYNGSAFVPTTVGVTMASPSKTIYAVWAKNYSLTYNANNGSNAPTASSYTGSVVSTSHDFTINTTTIPTRTGYTFLGYAESASATEATYVYSDSSFTPATITATEADADKTLYAIWEKEFRVIYNANGGENAPADDVSREVADSHTFTINTTIPTRDDYQFLGYATTNDATTATFPYTGSGFAPFINVTVYADNTPLTLYAVWQRVYTFTINYYTNEGGNVPESTVQVTTSDSATLNITASTIPSYTGHKFLGYDEDPDAETPTYAYDSENHTFTPSSISMTTTKATYNLYAIWIEYKDFELTYDLNYSTTDEAPTGETSNEAVTSKTFTLNTTEIPSRTGFAFIGYARTNTATEADFVYDATENTFDPATIELTADANTVTLYALWEKTFNLNYDSQNGLGEMFITEEVTMVAESYTFTLDTTVPVKTGYTFLGYADTATALSATYVYSGGTFLPFTTITVSASQTPKTIYAVWAKNYSLTYNANNGSNAPTASSYTGSVVSTSHDFTINTTTIPTRTGYTFLGYAESASATEATYVYSDSSFTPATITATEADADKTLYAIWEKEFKLIYDANSGSNPPAVDIVGKVAESNDFTINTTTIPTLSGKRFIGYADADDATEPDYAYNISNNTFTPATITVSASETPKTIYAVWADPYDYLLEYDLNYDATGTGVTAPSDQTSTTTDETTTFDIATAVIPTRDGYKFLGYSETNTAVVPEFAYDSEDGTFEPSQITLTSEHISKKLYAVWAKSYTLNYNANNGTGAPSASVFATTDASYTFTISTTIPTREGYKFLGYDEDSAAVTPYYPYDEATNTFTPRNSIELTESDSTKTLYAVWAQIYTYVFKCVDNSGSSEVVVYSETRTSTNLAETFDLNDSVSSSLSHGDNSIIGVVLSNNQQYVLAKRYTF